MSGTEMFPTVNEPRESWTPNPTRWPRLKAVGAVLFVIALGGVGGWFMTGDPIGALLTAVCLTVLTAALVAAPVLVVRLDAVDRRLSGHDRALEHVNLQHSVLRTRQDSDHATVSVLSHRLEEQHLTLGEYRSERRNNVLDMKNARRMK